MMRLSKLPLEVQVQIAEALPVPAIEQLNSTRTLTSPTLHRDVALNTYMLNDSYLALRANFHFYNLLPDNSDQGSTWKESLILLDSLKDPAKFCK